ncbi:MAG: hypothetical protein LH473_07405 [Chitinophagales bacterium]|nr:hypothetical protein [Chitinophagales bacterium]
MNKKHTAISIATLSLFALLFLTFSCNNNGTECTIPCYYGACVNNVCNCNYGFEGDSCTIRTVDRFIGNWDAFDSCQTNNYGYTATISASSSVINEILITNFGQFGTSFVATGTVTGISITIPVQNVQGIVLSGAGTIDTAADEISITFSVKDELMIEDACNGIWKKK